MVGRDSAEQIIACPFLHTSRNNPAKSNKPLADIPRSSFATAACHVSVNASCHQLSPSLEAKRNVLLSGWWETPQTGTRGATFMFSFGSNLAPRSCSRPTPNGKEGKESP